MKDIRNILLTCCMGIFALLLFFYWKQQNIMQILAESHRQLESWLEEPKEED